MSSMRNSVAGVSAMLVAWPKPGSSSQKYSRYSTGLWLCKRGTVNCRTMVGPKRTTPSAEIL